jgi:hypothetical protein
MVDQASQIPFSLSRMLLKGLVLFLALNLIFTAVHPLPMLGHISGYNLLFPGRERLPYGDKPAQAYNLSLFSLEAMFASHELAGRAKPADEFRVIVIGDSSVWGFLLKPEETLAAYLNAERLTTPEGKTVRAYNVGYPTMSLTKDLLMLSRAMSYQPDLILWLFTLESFPDDKQLDSPILQHNPGALKDLVINYSLDIDPDDPALISPTFLDQTIIGQRRALADIIRLQLYGVLWAATGIDQYYPETYEPPQENLESDESFHGMLPTTFKPDDLAFETLSAGEKIAGNIPIFFVNEPMYISHGENSDIRYNFFYPRWAYDQYRQLLADLCQQHGWSCLDVWDLVSPSEFTNSAIHLTPSGEEMLAARIGLTLIDLIRQRP